MTNNRSILIVEDDPDVLEAELQIFQGVPGLHLHSAKCVDTAIEKINSHSFDLIVSDFNLEDRTGLEIYEQAEKCGIPFIFYSGRSGQIPELKWPFIVAVDKPNIRSLVEAVEEQLGIKIVLLRA